MQLETARLKLREFHPDDWAGLAALTQPAMTEAQARQRVHWYVQDQTQTPRTQVHLAVTVRGAPGVVGRVGLRIESGDPGESELDVEIRPDQRRSGYATEACGAMLELAFAGFKLPAVRMVCPADSPAAIALAQDLGFIAVKQRSDYLLGGPGAVVTLRLTAQEWRARQRMLDETGEATA